MSTAQPPRAPSAGCALAECQAICVPPEMVPQIWPHVWERLQKVYQRTDLGRFKKCEEDVFTGRALLWLAWRQPEVLASVVTQIWETERSTVCLILACGGEKAREWLPLMASIEQYARAEGCNKIRIYGRKGWLRLLPDFHAPFAVIEKDLS